MEGQKSVFALRHELLWTVKCSSCYQFVSCLAIRVHPRVRNAAFISPLSPVADKLETHWSQSLSCARIRTMEEESQGSFE
ncbi:hypothetical protein TNCV_3840801 [Trichonephila clavipes]|nr:hypothetical protein TNCV_3840801 [Trichonephila clavipes]